MPASRSPVRKAAFAALGVLMLAPSAAADPVLDLLTAARRGDAVALRRALGDGAAVNAADPEFGQTALIRAAMFGQRESAAMLLAAKADPNKTSNLNRMALHWAATAGAADVIAILVKAGARVDVRDGYEATPLDYAAEAGQAAAAKALLASGASGATLHKPLSDRLAMAVGNGVTGPQLDVLLAIIASGQGLETRDPTSQQTALLAVADRAHRDTKGMVTAALVRAGADRNAKDSRGKTARQLVEESLAAQKDPASLANLRAAAAALR